MSGNAEKHNLADRTEAILRSDRQALVLTHRRRQEPTVLLTLVPNTPAIVDVMDAYIQSIADAAGLQYIRQVGADLENRTSSWLDSASLLLADLTGRDENVLAQVYEAVRAGRRVLLATQDAASIPPDLAPVQSVVYHLAPGGTDSLIQAVRTFACTGESEFVPLV